MPASREQDFITLARAETKKLWDAYHALRNMQTEWDGNDYSNTLDEGAGANLGYTKAMVSAVIFDTVNEIKLRIFDTAHKGNLSKLL